jgi:hypothetical protein
LIDGQQRFTTLFLLLFYCSLKEDRRNDFIELFKIDTDTENTSFDYRVRSLTHDFIIALVKNVDTIEKLRNIESATWFLSNFKNDVSIKSMLDAFKTFETELNEENQISFDYLKEQVAFWYFQTETTSQGEELYITMNSRGESIKEFENIKADLFERAQEEKMKFGKKYSIWEDFFWKISEGAVEREISFDSYMNIFFELVLQCETGSEKYLTGNNKFAVEEQRTLTFPILEKYVFALFNVAEFIEKNKDHFGIKDIISEFFKDKSKAENKIPLIATILFFRDSMSNKEISKHDDYLLALSDEETREIARVYHFFYNSVRRGRNEQNAVIRLMKESELSLSEFQESKHIQIDKLIDAKYESIEKNKQVNNILSKHEIDKLRIAKESEALRNKIEDTFWQVQNKTSYILDGSLRVLFDAMQWKDNYVWDNTTLDKFNEYEKAFSTIWSKENIKKPLCDNSEINNSWITRGLLTIRDYSIEVEGGSWSFGYDNRWNSIIENNPEGVVSTLLRKLCNKSNYIATIKELIADYVKEKGESKKDWIYYFVKYQEMTQPANDGRNLFRWWNDWNVRLLNKERLSGYNVNPYLWTLYKLCKSAFSSNGYTLGYYDSSLIFTNGLHLSVANEDSSTWIVKVPQNLKVSLDNLSKKYRNANQLEDAVDYFYKYEDTEDFIEEGIKLVKEIATLEVEDISSNI